MKFSLRTTESKFSWGRGGGTVFGKFKRGEKKIEFTKNERRNFRNWGDGSVTSLLLYGLTGALYILAFFCRKTVFDILFIGIAL